MSGPGPNAAGDDTTRRASVRDLPPSIFAVVMATGIVAEAADAAGAKPLGLVLFAVAAAAFVVLLVLLLARGLRFPTAVVWDARSHAAAPGFLTLVAAAGVLGTGCVQVADAPAAGLALWAATALLWVGLTYTLLPALIGAADKPPPGRGVDGTWLLLVVSTQAVAALGGAVLPHLVAAAAGPAGFAALCFWLAGVAQYLWLAPLVLHRLVFAPLDPADLGPPYWIGSGALSISALAGTTLAAAGAPPAAGVLPFVRGLTVFCWAAATWWVPLLVVLGAWRHLVGRVPLRYGHGYWAGVFPVGMYAACTMRVADDLGLPLLRPAGEAVAGAAVAAWAVTAVGLARRVVRVLRSD